MRGQVNPLLGNEKKLLARISRNISSQEQQDWYPKVISLIYNKKFNAPRGEKYLKFKRES